jgi:outer membrane protein TolC
MPFAIRISRAFIVIFVLVLLEISPLRAQDPQILQESEIDFTKPITLYHLLQCARQKNPAKKIAEAKLASGQADIFQAEWAHMPSIKNESGGVPLPQRRLMRYCANPKELDSNGYLNVAPCPDQGIQDDQRLSDTSGMGYFIRTQTTMTIPLITFGKISSGQEAAQAGFKAYEYALQSATRSFDTMVYQAYFGLQLTSQIAKIFADGQKEISKFKETIQKDIDQDGGKYNQNDLRKLLIREAEIAIKKTELDSIEEQTWGSIHILCKAPKLTQVQEIDQIAKSTSKYQSQYQLDQYELKALKIALKSDDVYFQKALENQPELKAAQWAVNARKAQVDLSQAQFMPNIALMSFLNFAKSNSAQDNPDPFANDPFNVFSWGAYLGIDWRFDFSRMIADVKRAKAVLQQSEAEQEALIQKTKMDLLERMTQIQKFEQVQKLRKDALKSAKQWFTSSALNTASGLGNSSADDLTRALAAYYEAAINHYQSISEYNIAVAKLAVLLNIPIEELIAL